MLNSVVNLHKAVSFFSRHRVVHALLDNDDAGQKALARLGESLPSSEVIDQSVFYRDHKYLNEYLQEKQHQQVQRKQQPHKDLKGAVDKERNPAAFPRRYGQQDSDVTPAWEEPSGWNHMFVPPSCVS